MYDQPQFPSIPVHTALNEFGMAPSQEETDFFRALIVDAAHKSDEESKSHVHVHDLFNAAVGAGLGAGAGSLVASTVSGLFGMPDQDRRSLIGAGALGGALYAMGLVKGGSEADLGMDKEAVLSDLLMMSVLFPYLLGGAARPQVPKQAPQNELDTAALVGEYNRGISQLKQEQAMQKKPAPEAIRGINL